MPGRGPRPGRAVPPSGRAPALAKLKFAKFFERTNDETELQESYRPKKLCTWSKIGQGIRFWRQKSPSSSKIDRNRRKTWFRHRKSFKILIWPRLGPRPCRAVPPSGRAPALAKLKFEICFFVFIGLGHKLRSSLLWNWSSNSNFSFAKAGARPDGGTARHGRGPSLGKIKIWNLILF